ncbi:hypothetical protein AB3X82_16465 [Paraburkholderia phenoliruptrix]|nr:hypothetical protein [Paraburkholderia phenoliruptrix]MDR6392101.1 hypothetical protein [Paraburkholderia phenoliruptrix]
MNAVSTSEGSAVAFCLNLQAADLSASWRPGYGHAAHRVARRIGGRSCEKTCMDVQWCTRIHASSQQRLAGRLIMQCATAVIAVAALAAMSRASARREAPLRGKTGDWRESNMFRLVGAGAVLLMIASTVSAGERYVEIWNPPEARIGQPLTQPLTQPSCRKSNCRTGHPSRHSTALTPRRVADPLANPSAHSRVRADNSKKHADPRPAELPRIITPEGNIFRVGTRDATVSVLR